MDEQYDRKMQMASPARYAIHEHIVAKNANGNEHVVEIVSRERKGILYYYKIKNVDKMYAGSWDEVPAVLR